MKDVLLSLVKNIGIICVKQALNRSLSKIKNMHRKKTQEINEIESLLIIEFMLGKKANNNNEIIKENKTEKEHYYA